MNENNAPDFILKDSETPDEADVDSLSRLKSFVDAHARNTLALKSLEEMVTGKKKIIQQLTQELIPQLLRAKGLSRIKLTTGEEVTVKAEVSVAISDKEKFIQFLHNRNEQDIVKLQLSFARMEQEKIEALYALLDNESFDFDAIYDVHASTRAAYFRRLLGIGQEDQAEGIAAGKYLRKEQVAEFANAFTFYKTTIKK